LRWLQRLKTSAATRRMPVVAFGPHVEAARLNQARQAGAEAVVPRSRLQSGLADLIRTHALPEMSDVIRSGCDRPLSTLAERGLDLMGQGAYFEAHEAFEQDWLKSEPAQHGLYRALVQTCVIYLHLQRGNRTGAAKLLLRVHQWLDPLPDRCSGLDVAAWKADLQALRAAMDAAGDDASLSIDPRLLRPIAKLDR
jgi:predicted metal-dependent hydrolase